MSGVVSVDRARGRAPYRRRQSGALRSLASGRCGSCLAASFRTSSTSLLDDALDDALDGA